MRVHNLKILNDFADAVVMGEKPFEIRKNDRGYQKGDYIKFQAIDESGTPNQHCIKNGYVVLGIKESEGIHD